MLGRKEMKYTRSMIMHKDHLELLRLKLSCILCLLLSAVILLSSAPGVSAQTAADDTRSLQFSFRVNGFDQDSVFGELSALALDESNGLFYVADTKFARVYGFTLQGVPKLEYGLDKGLESPVGLAVDKQGNLYVSEKSGGPIKMINPKGEVSKFDLPAVEGGDAPKPGRMTFDRDGNLYVVDRANCRVLIFDKDHKLKQSIGGKGDKRGQFKSLEDVAVDRQGRVYALDSEGTPVQVFDKKGKYVYRFGFRGDGDQDISFASGLFIDQNDQIWIVDRGRHALKVFDRSGEFLRRLGTYGVDEGYLFQPVDADMDSLGRVYIAEAGARRVQVFSLSQPFEPFNPPGL